MRLARRRAAALLAALLGITVFAPVGRASSNTFTLLTGGTAHESAFTYRERISSDGSRVYFTTLESLSPADGDANYDIYRASGGLITLITVGTPNKPSEFLAESADGSRVFFLTNEAIAGTGDADTGTDIYQWSAGAITLISGGADNWDVEFVGISADGSKVFFNTRGSLDAADTDGDLVDGYEASGGSISLITAGTDTDIAFVAGASADGTRVFFKSYERVVAADVDDSLDVYEVSGGITTLRTGGPAACAGGPPSFFCYAAFVAVSADGNRLFFRTKEQLSASDTDSVDDFYVHDSSTGLITLLSGTTDDPGLQNVFAATADGSRVFLQSNTPLAGEPDDGAQDVYQSIDGVITLLSGGTASTHAYFSGASADGTKVFFMTDESLDPADVDATQDVYQASGGVITLLSGGGPTCIYSPANYYCAAWFDAASSDGSRVFFHTLEQLTADDIIAETNPDVYEASGGVISLRTPGGVSNYSGSYLIATSADGSMVFFQTDTQLDPADTDSATDVYKGVLSTTDGDGDGVVDGSDNCPADANPGQSDVDGDGIGDACDSNNTDGPLGDLDQDGVANNGDNCPVAANADQLDTDGDHTGDACDIDDDNDGVLDANDAFPLDPSESVDTDHDGIGNNADTDDDGDGLADGADPAPLDPDADDDGVQDGADNCRVVANASQLDTDGDHIGDACDADDDNDGVLDANDAFPLDPSESVDTDHDGTGNNADADDDNDSDPDATDCAPLNPQIGHHAAEIANGIDDNCNGQIDENQGQLTFGGLLSPYAPPPATFKLGRTIPLKWQYRNAQGVVVDSAGANPVVNVYGPVSCGETTGGASIDVSAPGASGYQYEAGTKMWAFNWQTKGLAPGCYYLNVTSAIAQSSAWLSIQLK